MTEGQPRDVLLDKPQGPEVIRFTASITPEEFKRLADEWLASRAVSPIESEIVAERMKARSDVVISVVNALREAQRDGLDLSVMQYQLIIASLELNAMMAALMSQGLYSQEFRQAQLDAEVQTLVTQAKADLEGMKRIAVASNVAPINPTPNGPRGRRR